MHNEIALYRRQKNNVIKHIRLGDVHIALTNRKMTGIENKRRKGYQVVNRGGKIQSINCRERYKS